MKVLHLLAASAAFALPVVASAQADARQTSVFGLRTPPPRHHGGRLHGGFHIPFIIVEREIPVIIEREVVREVAPAAPPAPPPPRKPYVIGKGYASLPASCMKLIQGGASYYYCGGGEWYRLAGKRYLAVAKPS